MAINSGDDWGTIRDQLNAIFTAANAARDKAAQWAEESVDVEVETAKYSAKHHSEKASAQRALAETAKAGAETARDAAEDAVQYDYIVDDATALAALTGMATGQRAYVRDTEHVWKYDGAAWQDQGLSVTSAKADTTYVDGLFALTEQYTVDAQNLYNASAKRDGYYISSSTGVITTAAGWACSAFIPVTPGAEYTVSADAIRQGEIGFYSSASDSAVVSFVTGNAISKTVTAPAGAAFMAFTVKSTFVPEPANIRANYGDTSLPHLPYTGEPHYLVDATRLTGAAETEERFVAVEGRLDNAEANLLDVSNQFDISQRRDGYYVNNSTGGIQTAAGWACTGFIPVSPGDVFTISADGSRQPEVGFYSSASDTAQVGVSAGNSGTKTVTVPAGANFMAFNILSAFVSEPSNIMLSKGASAFPYQAYDGEADFWLNGDRIVRSDAVVDTGFARLALSGAGTAFVESAASGNLIRNEFIPFPTFTLTTYPCRLNLRGTYLNGALVRDAGDDIAPDHTLGTVIGGNHGYYVGIATVTAHGKVEADQGSIWTSGGAEVILVEVRDADTLVLAHRTINTAPATGAYTHVSGATNTGGFTVSAVTASQSYRPDANYQITVSVDGKQVTETSGEWLYSDNVTITETCDLLARSEILDWWIANGGVSGGLAPDGDPSYTMTNTYRWDRDGQLTMTRDWLFLKATSMYDLMGIQVARASSPASYYVPGALPMTHDGASVDYSRKVASDLTVTSGLPVYLTDTELQASGEYAHRLLSLWSDKAFAAGFLPVGDAALDVRRSRVSGKALEIFGNSGKVYFRALDLGGHTAQPGDYYTVTGYRHVCESSADRTSFYVVRQDGADYVFADWHNVTTMDRLPIPSDLWGREFSVVDSRNVTVKGGTMQASLPVYVDAAGDYGYAVLKVEG